MGYYTKHIVRIIPFCEDAVVDKELYLKLAHTIEKYTGYGHWTYINDSINDRKWNGGSGTKWYEIRETLHRIAKELPNIRIRVDCVGEGYFYSWDDEYYEPPYSYEVCNGEFEFVEYSEDMISDFVDRFDAIYEKEGEIFPNIEDSGND